MPERIYTIGFAKKRAEAFFEALRATHTARVLDIRLQNTSQLAGFTKREDLPYFLRALLGMEYQHVPELAPTEEILARYKAEKDWQAYVRDFRALLAERDAAQPFPSEWFEPRVVLLCSEPDAAHCHRSLVAEYLRATRWPALEIVHL